MLVNKNDLLRKTNGIQDKLFIVIMADEEFFLVGKFEFVKDSNGSYYKHTNFDDLEIYSNKDGLFCLDDFNFKKLEKGDLNVSLY